MRSGMEGASAHSAEPSMNRIREMFRMRRRP
jgi:hypothetical protein